MIPRHVRELIFTHKGWYAGIVPVYVVLEKDLDYNTTVNACPMAVRNGIPNWVLPLVIFLWTLLTMFNPYLPPLYVTGEIDEL